MLAARAAMRADMLKLSSNVEQMTSPKTTGINDRMTNILDVSPKIIFAKSTVKTGAADLTVSAKETGANQRAISPNKSVVNLKHPTTTRLRENLSLRNNLLDDVLCRVDEIIPMGTFTWKYPPIPHINN